LFASQGDGEFYRFDCVFNFALGWLCEEEMHVFWHYYICDYQEVIFLSCSFQSIFE